MKLWKNCGKRSLSLFLALVMCLGMLNLTAFAAEDSLYDCGLEEHTHTSACYETVRLSDEPTCGLEEGVGAHMHSEDCYGEPVLSCGLEESEGHTHGTDCYTTEITLVETQVLTCGEAESEGHTHSDSCYTVTYEDVLTCGEAESSGHTHSDSCYDEDGSLTCGETESSGHTHSSSCYSQVETGRALTCGLEESSGHSHSSACYTTESQEVEEQVLVCTLEESEGHSHSDSCMETPLICGQEESNGHVHSDACYETETVLVCGKQEHTHTDACLAKEPGEPEQLPENPEELPEDLEELPEELEELPEEAADISAEVNAFVDAANRFISELESAVFTSEEELADYMEALNWKIQAMLENLSDEAWADPDFVNAFMRLQNAMGFASVTLDNSAGVEQHAFGGSWGRYAVNTGIYSISGLGDYFFHSKDGKIAYCVEPGAGGIADDNDTSSSSWNPPAKDTGYPEHPLTAAQIRYLVNLVIACGYNGNYMSAWSSKYYDGKDDGENNTNYRAKAIATQLLVWEVIVGDRDMDFNLVEHPGMTYGGYIRQSYSKSDGYGAPGTAVVGTGKNMFNSVCGDDYNIYANAVAAKCAAAKSVLSLGGSYKLEYDSNKKNYTKTIPGNFAGCTVEDIQQPDGATVMATSSSSGITVTSTAALSSPVTIKVKTPIASEGILVWSDGLHSSGQDIAMCSSGVAPEYFSQEFTVTADEALGSLTVKKTVNANGYTGTDTFTFTITGTNYSNTVTIKGAGEKNITGLKAGTYNVVETSNSNYTVDVGTQSVEVKAGETASVSFTNTRKTGELSFTKKVDPGNYPLSSDPTSFKFTVSLPDTNKSYEYTITGGGSGQVSNNGEIALKSGQTATISGIPVGVTCTVTENGNTTLYDITPAQQATIKEGSNDLGTFTNTRRYADLKLTKTVTWDPNSSQTPPAGSVFTFEVTLGSGTTPQSGDSYVGPGIYTLTSTLSQDNLDNAVVNPDGTKTATCPVQTISAIPTGTSYSIVETDFPEDFNAYDSDFGPQTAPVSTTGTVSPATGITKVESTVKNRYFKSLTTEISGYKDWSNVPVELLPDFITVQLSRTSVKDGKEIVSSGPVYNTAPTSTLWGYSFGELPCFAIEGDEYQYAIEETGICYENAAEQLANYLNKTPGPKEYSHIAVDKDYGMFVIYGTATVTDLDTDTTQWETLGAWIPSYETTSDGQLVIKNRWLGSEDIGEVDFKVRKVDAENTQWTLEGAEFTLFTQEEYEAYQNLKDGARIVMGWTKTTDQNGELVFPNLVGGVYILKETKAPVGHVLNETVWTVTVGKTDLVSVEATYDDSQELTGWKNLWNWGAVAEQMTVMALDEEQNTLTVSDARIKGYIGITKEITLTTGDNWSEIDRDFTFEVRNSAGTVVDTVTVKAGETKSTKLLDYGVYTVTETNDTDFPGFQWNSLAFTSTDSNASVSQDGSSIKVNITTHGKTYAVTAENSYTELGGLSLSKNVTGGDGSRSRDWNFVLTLEGNTGRNPEFEFSGTQSDSAVCEDNEDGTYTVTMKHGVTLTITGLSIGTTYSVYEVEANQSGYTTSATKDGVLVPYVDRALNVTGEIAKDVPNEVIFTNHNPSSPDNPRTPETPEEPEEPETPEEPELPEDPTEPETPIEPEIPDEPVPMEDLELYDDDVPLSSMPEEEEIFDEEEILDEEVPLLDVSPETGDNSRTSLWVGLCALSLLGIAALLRKKRGE